MLTLGVGNAWGESTSTLTFTNACSGSGTADDGAVWTVTSDAAESDYEGTRGIHYGTSKKAVSYLNLTTSDISGTITQIVVNASGASGTSAKLNVTVGGSAFGSEQSLTSSAANYTLTGSASGEIVVAITQSSAKKAIYCKSITVTYTAGGGGGGTAYTVTFDKGTGTCSTASLTEASAGAGVTLPTPTHPCSSDGWTFAGWTTGSLVTSETTTTPDPLYTGGSNYKPSSDITLYAVYQQSGDGLYHLITTLPTGDDIPGNYMVVNTSAQKAMDAYVVSSYYLDADATGTITSNTIDPDNVTYYNYNHWKVTYESSKWIFYNESQNKYLYNYCNDGTHHNVGITSTKPSGYSLSLSSGYVIFNSADDAGAGIFYNSSYTEFAGTTTAYTTAAAGIHLYKEEATTYYSNPSCVECTENPTVSAASNSDVATTTATVSCTGISSLGSAGCVITDYGFVIGTSENPAIGGSGVTKHQVGTTYTTVNTSFNKNLTELTEETTYYVRPYATNGHGTAYGTQTSFTTTALPKYTVTFHNMDGASTPVAVTQASNGAAVTLPSASPSAACTALGWTFAGWKDGSAQTEVTAEPAGLIAAGSYTPEGNKDFYAVYRMTEGGGSGFTLSLTYNETEYYVGAKGDGSFLSAVTNPNDAVTFTYESSLLSYDDSGTKKYISSNGDNTTLTVGTDVPSSTWTESGSDTYTYTSSATGNRNLAWNYNSGSPRFAAYKGSATYLYHFTKHSSGTTTWMSNPNCTGTVTLTYDANGANSGSVPAVATGYDRGTYATILGNTGDLAKTNGTVFGGWNTKADGSGTTYQAGNLMQMKNDQTLYVRWITPRTVTIIDNGHSSEIIVADGDTYALPEEGESTCEDATLLGWYTDTGSGDYHDNHLAGTSSAPSYDAPGAEKTITANVTFVAVYGTVTEDASDEYTKITSLAELQTGDYLIAAHGSYYEYAMKNEVVSSNYMDEETFTLNANPITTTDAALIWRITKSGSNYTIYNANVNKYFVAGTSGPELSDASHNYTVGYTGDSWIFESTTTGYQLAYNGYFRSLTAQGAYEIYLYRRGSAVGNFTSKPQCCHEPATALAIETDATNFVGSGVAHLTLTGGNGKDITWTTTAGTLSEKTNSGATLTMPTVGATTVYTVTATQADDTTDPDNVICGASVSVDITVKAQYTVSYKYVEEGGSQTEIDNITVTDGVEYTLPDISDDFTCSTGVSFAGWSTSSTATSVEKTAGETATVSENTTWYAVWREAGATSSETRTKYSLVSDIASLQENDVIVLAYTNIGMTTISDGNYAEYGEGLLAADGSYITFPSAVEIQELTLKQDGDNWNLYTGSKYLTFGKKVFNLVDDQSNANDLTITIADDVATITNSTYTLRYNSSSPRFAPYSSTTLKLPSIYKKDGTISVSAEATAQYTTETTCTTGAVIKVNTNNWITSANGQKVKMAYALTAKGFDAAETLSITGNTDATHFAVSLLATNVPATPGQLDTYLVVEYTPSEENTSNSTSITLTAGEVSKTVEVNGRSLPEEFVMIAKKSLWYALPANMNNNAGQYNGVSVTPDDASEPTQVPVSPSTIIYSLKAVASTRYEDAGNCVRLVGNNNKCLWANASNNTTTIQNYAALGESNGSNYEWLLTTTDGQRYTITNPAHPNTAEGRQLATGGTGGTQFGLYKTETTFFLVPVGCSSQPQDVAVSARRVDATFSWVSNASSMEIKIYSDEGMTSEVKSETATSSPHTILGLDEQTNYWYKLIPETDEACAVTGTFTTTGPVIDVVEWQENAAVIFVDKNESVDPIVIIDGQVESGIGTGATATTLFFSKYFEGAGTMKLISIFNGTASDISLSGFKIVKQNANTDDGVWKPTSNKTYYLDDLGTIKAGQEIIFYTQPSESKLTGCSEEFFNGVSSKSTIEDNPRWINCDNSTYYGDTKFIQMDFNGNDAMILYDGSSVVDIIGATGTPGNDKPCLTGNSERSWEGQVLNMDFKKKPGAEEYEPFYDNSSLDFSTYSTQDSIDFLENCGVNLTDSLLTMYTARCILFRNNKVTEGVTSNTGAEFESFTPDQWNGRSVCQTSDMYKAAGYEDDGRATCNSYQDLGKFDYSKYYKDWTNIDEGTVLSNYTKDAEAKEYTIPISNLAQYSCLQLRFQLKQGETVLTETPVQVPIIVTDAKSTNSAIFNEIVKDDDDNPLYAMSINRCKTCDVVVLGTGTLTKATDGATNDVPQVANLKVYPGGKLIVPTETNYTVNTLSFRRQEDAVSAANLLGNLTVSKTNGVYLDIRIDPTNWHYFSLPYDCRVGDIRFSDDITPAAAGTDFLLGWYDGEYRAEHKTGGWTYITDPNYVLKAGLGYIIALPGSGKVKRELRFPMANDVIAAENTDKTIEGLYAYGGNKTDTELGPNHKGWNMIGNPYLYDYTTDIVANPLAVGTLVHSDASPWDGKWKRTGEARYIVAPVDNGWSGYIQTTISNISPFTAYFIQIGEKTDGTEDPTEEKSISFHKDHAGKSSVVARRMAEEETEDTHPVWCAVDLTSPQGEQDETTLLISNDFTDAYDMMDDLIKMRGSYYTYYQKPVFASRNAKEELAFNALPDSTAAIGVPLNYFAASQGTYTISYNDKYGREEVKSVMLLDNTTNQWYDLMESSYSFTTNRTDNKDRFILSVRVERKKKDVATGMDQTIGEGNSPRKILIDGHVYILRGDAVYDITGKQMFNRK